MKQRASSAPLQGMEIAALGASEVGAALSVLARGMRDNPIHVAAFGEDPALHERRLHRFWEGAFAAMPMARNMLAARGDGGEILAVCGMFEPGDRRLAPEKQPVIAPYLLENGPDAAERTMRWVEAWTRRDPEERHWHFGPSAVDAHLQGRGIGSNLLRVFCAKMDALGEEAFLETDKPANVRLYRLSGFEVIGEEAVLGVTNWFMLRQPQGEG